MVNKVSPDVRHGVVCRKILYNSLILYRAYTIFEVITAAVLDQRIKLTEANSDLIVSDHYDTIVFAIVSCGM